MSIGGGLLAWRKHVRQLFWIAFILAFFCPALGREGIDISYPLIRVLLDGGLFGIVIMFSSEGIFFVVLMVCSLFFYFSILFGALSFGLIVLSGVFGPAPTSVGPSE